MFGVGFAFYFPQYFWLKEHPLASILMWLFRLELSLPCLCDGRVELRVLGCSVSIGWTTLGHIARAKESAAVQARLMERMADLLNKASENVAKSRQKSEENAQNDAKNDEKATENVKKASKPVYQDAEDDGDGIRAVNVRTPEAREMMQSNIEWYMEHFMQGAKLVVSTDEYVLRSDRSFTLPDYEHRNSLEIGDLVVFGDEENHLKAKITGYQQSPEGERTYFYQAA